MSDFGEVAGALDELGRVWDDPELGWLLVTNKVKARNKIGRFTANVEEANRRATDEAGRRGAQVMRSMMPKRTGRLAATVKYSTTGERHGEITWGTGAGYWRYVAYGAAAHEITGWVRFWWEREGRRWVPGPNIIHHPGIKPHPFVDVTYRATQLELENAMRREYRNL